MNKEEIKKFVDGILYIASNYTEYDAMENNPTPYDIAEKFVNNKVEEYKKKLVEEIKKIELEKYNNAQHNRILSGQDCFEDEMWWTTEIEDLINKIN